MKHFGDITKLNGAELPVVDVITGGSPCQDLSVAGKRAGLDGGKRMSEELKPCPFCGGNNLSVEGITFYWVECIDCNASISGHETEEQAIEAWNRRPSAEPERKNVIEIPETGIGDLSDGYHTFNGLYEQRMILFAALVKAYKDRAWKSYRHEDGEWCFGGGWFIVGIDTPEGSYTYHYENKYWDMFDCADLPRGKHWDGHTEADAETRLLSLEPERKKGKWMPFDNPWYKCSECGAVRENKSFMENFCPNCGADMRGGEK